MAIQFHPKKAIYLVVIFAIALTACAPGVFDASTATPTQTPSPSFTPSPSPTATATATPDPRILLFEELVNCTGFEILCSNPNASGLSGRDLTNWRDLRKKINLQLDLAWKSELLRTKGDGKLQQEFLNFFGKEAPEIGNWDTLNDSQKTDLVAAYLRVYTDGLAPANIPTTWITKAISDPTLYSISYKVNKYYTMGYPFLLDPSYFDGLPTVSSFGEEITLAWPSRQSGFSFWGNGYVSPLNYPGKPFNQASIAWLYLQDEDGNKHSNFVFMPTTRQINGTDTTFTVGGNYKDKTVLKASASTFKTVLITLNQIAPQKQKASQYIGNQNFMELWRILVLARKNNLYVKTAIGYLYDDYKGGLDIIASVTVISFENFEFPLPLPSSTPTAGPVVTPRPTITPIPNKEVKIDGSPDEWGNIICLQDEKGDGWQNPKLPTSTLAMVDFKQFCYFVQNQTLYVLIEVWEDIKQNEDDTKIVAYRMTFGRTDENDSDTPNLTLTYVPGIGIELYRWQWSPRVRDYLDTYEIDAAYKKNYIEIAIPLKIIQEEVSTAPFITFYSLRQVNEYPGSKVGHLVKKQLINISNDVDSYPWVQIFLE